MLEFGVSSEVDLFGSTACGKPGLLVHLHAAIENTRPYARFELPTGADTKSCVFWNITRRKPLKVGRPFGGVCRRSCS
jgi:hypothetical protein